MLGIKPDADQLEITRAYNRKRYEYRNNTSMIQKVEAAHGQLVMAAFNARLQVRGHLYHMTQCMCMLLVVVLLPSCGSNFWLKVFVLHLLIS